MRATNNCAPTGCTEEARGITREPTTAFSHTGVDPQRRRLPPYGRRLLTLRDQGQAPALAVLVTDRWELEPVWAEHAPWIVAVPDGAQATGFDFRFVAGLFVYVIAADSYRADEIAGQVWRFHPRMVFSWSADDGQFTFHSGGAR